jgi:opacity protein-like surface antigen
MDSIGVAAFKMRQKTCSILRLDNESAGLIREGGSTMSRYCIGALMILVSVSLAAAGASAGGDLTAQGSKQMVFGFSGFSLTAYGGGFGVRYFLADRVAIVPSLAVWLSTSSDDDTDIYSEARSDLTTTDLEQSDIGIKLTLERYFGASGPVFPYVGGGVRYGRVTYDRNRDDESIDEDAMDKRTTTSDDNRVTNAVDVFLALGLQWAFAEQVSLGGQYTVAVRHEWRDEDYISESDGDVRTSSTKTRATSFDAAAGRLLVSVRF